MLPSFVLSLNSMLMEDMPHFFNNFFYFMFVKVKDGKGPRLLSNLCQTCFDLFVSLCD